MPDDADNIQPYVQLHVPLPLIDTGSARVRFELVNSFDITTLSRPLVDGYAKLTGRKEVAKLLEEGELARFAADRQLIDLLERAGRVTSYGACAAECDDGHAVDQRIGKAGGEIDCARAGCAHA